MKITNRHLRKLKYIAPVFCSMAVLSTQLQAGPTVQLNGDELRDGMADSGSLGYVGGNTRIGVSINRDLEGQVDLNQIIMEDDSSATSAEGWFGYKIKDDENSTKGLTGGGVKLNHQWVNDERDTVHKVFGAYDRDTNDRAKATVGYGQETEDLFWSGHVSKSLSEDVVSNGIATRAYDYGVGAQVGTFLDSTLTRIRGGVDYEFGAEFADGEERPGKATLSAGIEQFFHDSPHSITLDVSGNQVSGGNDAENTDFGARLGYRYEFGGDGVYRSAGGTSRRRVEIPGQPGRPGRAGVPAIPPTPATPGRPAIPGRAAIPGRPGRAAIPGRPGRAAIPPRYERRAVNAPGHEFVKTTMKLENETFFKLNSSKLTPSAMRNLDKIVGQIRGHGYLGAIRITGNTCGLGDPAYDQRLSEKRANAVRTYLVNKGFNPEHLIARGLGKGSPKYDRRDDDFRNRRVDLEYVTERTVKKAANKTQYRNVLVQEGRPAVAAIPGRPAIPARAGRPAQPGRPAIPGRPGSPGRAAIPAIPATPGTPSRFVWRTEVVPSAPIWIQRAIRNTISHNKSISTYTTRVTTKTADDIHVATNRTNTIDVLNNDATGLTLHSVTQPANGVVDIVDGKVVYIANTGFSGTDTFTYTVKDADGNELTSRVTVDVPVGVAVDVNTAPVAVDDMASTSEATSVLINVIDNDTDIDNDTLEVTSMTTPANGTVQLVNGQIQYTPNPGFSGTDMFEYTITDGNNNQSTAMVKIDVADINQAPVAVNDISSTPEGTPVTINVIDNDTDADGDALTVITLGQASNGSVAIVNNQVVYTPNAGFSGADSFTYVVTDNNGNSTTAMVNVNVTSVNSAPTATDDVRTTPENTPVTIAVLGNDTDPDGDTLSIVSSTNPSNGTVSVSNGNIVYTPNNGFSGQDTFNYTITDGQGNNVTATVIVTVTDTNVAPIAADDMRTTPENTPVTISVLGNDTDPDGDALSIVGATSPSNGTVSVSNGNIVYTPNNGFSGQDTFTYTITDGQGNNVTATVIVTVTDVNVAPIAVNDMRTTPENTSVSIPVLGNDNDPDGDTISLVSNTAPTNGTAVISGNNIIYTPNNGYSGQDTFDYTITDGQGNNVTATVLLTITDVNMAPMAVDDKETTDENTAVTINVLSNDSDPDGDTVTLVSNTAPANGTAVISGGNIIYTPAVGFTGTDTFNYTITDGNGNNVTATAIVTVNDVNYPPVASDDNDTTPQGTPVTINVITNDGDIDGDTITVTNVGTPSNGTASISGNSIVYTPNSSFVGTDTFTYTINDGNGHPVTANVSVVVTAVNQDPIAVNDSASTPYQTPVTINVAANDTDPDGTTTCVSNIVSNPSNGMVSISANGTDIIYTPNAGFTGTDTFVYTACDANGGTDTATVTVTVGGAPNQAPTASNDNATTDQNTQITMSVMSNDTDPEGDNLTLVSTSNPANGSAVISGGNVIYTPNTGFSGTDSYTYVISDGNGNTSTATATVTVNAVNQAPVAMDDNASTPYQTPVTINVAANDTDPDGTTTCISNIASNPSNGSVSISTSGVDIIYTPNPGFTGTDTFVYTACDANGGTDTATVTVTVGGAPNQAPTASNDNATTDQNTQIIMGVMSNDTDPEGDNLTLVSTSNPANGSAVISGSNVIYTPNTGFSGTDSYTYVISDGNGNTSTATATVTVNSTTSVNAVADTYDTDHDTYVWMHVMTNDNNPEGTAMNICNIVSGPSNGSAFIDPNMPHITYTPNTGFTGVDTMTYQVCDAEGDTDTASITINVNAKPRAAARAGSTSGPMVAPIPAMRANASGTTTTDIGGYLSDAGGNSVYIAVADALSGSVSFSGTRLQYTPDPSEIGFGATDQIYLTVSNGQGGTADSVITVNLP